VIAESCCSEVFVVEHILWKWFEGLNKAVTLKVNRCLIGYYCSKRCTMIIDEVDPSMGVRISLPCVSGYITKRNACPSSYVDKVGRARDSAQIREIGLHVATNLNFNSDRGLGSSVWGGIDPYNIVEHVAPIRRNQSREADRRVEKDRSATVQGRDIGGRSSDREVSASTLGVYNQVKLLVSLREELIGEYCLGICHSLIALKIDSSRVVNNVVVIIAMVVYQTMPIFTGI